MIKLPAHLYLDDKNISYETMVFPVDIEKGAASVARALGFNERQMIKTLIFETETHEKILVMVGGDQSIKSGLLKKAASSRNLRLAPPEVVIATTGYPIGSIPPFHWQPKGFRSFLEASLLNEERLGVGTGEWGHEIIIRPEDLVRAAGAEVASLCELSLRQD